MTGEEFRAAVAPLARRIARQGTTWFLPFPTWARVLVFLLGLVVLSLVAGLLKVPPASSFEELVS